LVQAASPAAEGSEAVDRRPRDADDADIGVVMGIRVARRGSNRWGATLVAVLVVTTLVGASVTTAAAADTRSGRRSPRGAALKGPEAGVCGADVPALGMPIDTVFGRSNSVKIGTKEYAVGSPWLHLVVVNRCTLEVRDYRYSDRGEDLDAMKALIDKLDSKSLVIVAAPLGLGLSYARSDALNRDILRPIGAAPIPINQTEKPFSVIGAPGWTVGAAFQNRGSRLGVPGQAPSNPGSLRGYLQKDIAKQLFTFVFPDFVRVSTRSDGTATTNTMTVGATTQPGSIPDGRSGFQLVVLNSRTLDVIQNGVYPTNGAPDPGSDELQQRYFGEALQKVDGNQIALVQSIGAPKPTTVGWNEIAKGIDRLGGERTVVNQLAGQAYGLIASPAWRAGAKESVADKASQQLGAVGSLLGRTDQSAFIPVLTDLTGATSGNDLVEIAYKPATAWPLRDTPQHLAAIKFVADALGLKVDDPRLRYTDLGIAFSDAQYLGKLQAMTYPGSPAFSAQDFAAVKAQLEQEFGWVSTVRSFIDRLKGVTSSSVISNSLALNRVTREIRSAVSDEPVEVNPYEILSIIAKMAGVAAEHAAAEPEVAGALSFISGAFALAAMATSGPKGQSPLDVFIARKDQLSDELADRFQGTLNQLGQLRSILVTDAGKLQESGTAIADGKPGWKMTDDTIAVAQRSEGLAAQQLYASTLLRIPYVAYRLPDGYPTPTTCKVLGPNQPPSAWMTYVSGFSQQGAQLQRQTVGWAIGTAREDDRWGRMAASADLINPLFEPVSADFTGKGLGLYKPRFLATNFSVRDLPRVNCMQR
jgi:hypothetical protein